MIRQHAILPFMCCTFFSLSLSFSHYFLYLNLYFILFHSIPFHSIPSHLITSFLQSSSSHLILILVLVFLVLILHSRLNFFVLAELKLVANRRKMSKMMRWRENEPERHLSLKWTCLVSKIWIKLSAPACLAKLDKTTSCRTIRIRQLYIVALYFSSFLAPSIQPPVVASSLS